MRTNSGPGAQLATAANGAVTILDSSGAAIYSATSIVPLPIVKWRSAVSAAAGAVRPAKLLVIGDSNVVGQGAGTGTNGMVGARAKSFPVLAATKLNRLMGRVSSDSFFGDQNVSAASSTADVYDTRIVFGSGWSASAGGPSTLGGHFLAGAPSAAGELSITPVGQFDRFTLFYPKSPTAATALNVKVDGVSVGTINQAAANSFNSITYSVALGAHVLSFATGVTGTAFITGAYFWDSSNPGIVMLQGGWCAGRAADFVSTTSAWSPFNSLATVAPDMTVLYCSINDIYDATAAATYAARIDSFVVEAVKTGDVQMIMAFPGNSAGTTNGLLDQYMAALKVIARTRGAGLIDIRQSVGANWTAASALGYIYDAYHPSYSGHSAIAGVMANALYIP